MGTKITELTQLTDTAKDQIVAVVEDPGGSPVTKKVQLNDIVNPAFGSWYIATGTTTAITTSGVWYKLGITTTTAITERNFTHTNPNKLTYGGANDIHAVINASITISCTTAPSSMSIALAKNGTLIASNAARATSAIKGAGSYHNLAITYDDTLANGDYLEIYCDCSSSATVLTSHFGTMNVRGIWGT